MKSAWSSQAFFESFGEFCTVAVLFTVGCWIMYWLTGYAAID